MPCARSRGSRSRTAPTESSFESSLACSTSLRMDGSIMESLQRSVSQADGSASFGSDGEAVGLGKVSLEELATAE